MNSRGILFYINFAGPTPLLPVALHSLSKYYDGDIHVLYGEQIDQWMIDQLKKCDRITHSFHKKKLTGIGKQRWRISILEKPYLYYSSPFNTTLFYDCDHLFLRPMDMSIFDEIEEYGLVNPIEDYGDPIAKQDRVCKAAHDLYGRDLNKVLSRSMGGCVGILRGTAVNDRLVQVQKDLMNYPGRNIFSDEHALSLVLEESGKVLDVKWSWTYKQNKHNPKRDHGLIGMPDNLIALHFAHKRYAISKMWRDAYLDAREQNVLGLDDCWEKYWECNVHVRDVVEMDESIIKA